MGGAVSNVVGGVGDVIKGGVDIAGDMLKPAEDVFKWSTENPLEAAALGTGLYFAAPAIAGALGGTGAAAGALDAATVAEGFGGAGAIGSGGSAGLAGLAPAAAGAGTVSALDAATGFGSTAAANASSAVGGTNFLGGAVDWAKENPLSAAGLGLTAVKALGGSQPTSSTSSTAIDPEMKAAYLRNLEEARATAAGLGTRQFAAFPEYSTNVVEKYMNPYQQEVIDASMADLNRQRQMQQVKDLNTATAAKAFGGSRQGVAQALTNESYDRTAASTLANLRSQGFGNAQAIALAQEEARRQYEQQKLDAARNLGLERLNISSGALGLQPANLGGTSTTPIYRNPTASALGGALSGGMLGNMIGGSTGAGYGALAGGLLGIIP
jgi:hypothetical protein